MPIWLIQLLIGIAFGIAGQIVQSMARQDARQDVKASGVRGTLQWGGDLSPRFIVGHYADAGQLRYGGTWGDAGGTPNAYYSQVVEVSCLPIRGYAGWFVNGERVTLADTKTGDLGYAVLEYRRGGVDYMWINPYLGDQTAEDPLMLAKFGDDPDRPYAGMIGRGCGYFVATALINRDLFNGLPEVLAEVDGIELDDPRGDDVHDNPIVAAYTVLKGLSYDGEWIWGPQGITDAHFRAANLEAEADKCDADRTLDGGGTERRFRIGMAVALEEEPQAIVGELLKACSGRWADLGGVYRFLVGAPGDPVVSFTDEDVVISQPQELDPFPGLESLSNAMTATYPEPDEAWAMKQAPRYQSDTLEAEDDGRRLPFSTAFRAVPYAIQVQELMRTTIEDARRFRRHTQTMPPEWWEYEPLDAVAWTSARNGYDAKAHLIVTMDDLPNGNQFVALQEIDPADYSWSSEFQLPYDTAPLTIARPAPQAVADFSVAPYVIPGSGGAPFRAGIQLFWDGSVSDVRALLYEVRLASDDSLVLSGEFATRFADGVGSTPAGALQSVTGYEVRGRYDPFSARETTWSSWLPVTTPDVPAISPGEIAVAGRELFAWQGQIRTLVEQFKQLGTLIEAMDRDNFTQRQTLSRSISTQLGNLSASFDEIIEVAIGPGGAIATALSSLYAAMGGNNSQVNVRWQAVAAPDGYSARYAIEAAVNDGTFRSATVFLDVPEDTEQPTRIGFAAGQTVFFTSDFTPLALIGDDGVFRSANDSIQIDMINGSFLAQSADAVSYISVSDGGIDIYSESSS